MSTTSLRAEASPTGGASGASDWSEHLARFGLVGKGVLHAVIGLLALQLALGGAGGGETSTSGALEWIAALPAGVLALWALGFSLASLALWRGVTTITGDPAEDDDGWYRAVWAAKAIVYGALAVTTLRAAAAGGSSGSSGREQESNAASTAFDLPMGRWIVVGVGLAVVGVAIYAIAHHAVGAAFAERLRVSEDDDAVTLGRIGYGLRSLAYVFVGVFLVQAGFSGSEQRADGLAGSLERVADASWGTILLVGMAVGFMAYGAYCVVESRLRVSA